MDRLRSEAVLADAIQDALAQLDGSPFGFAHQLADSGFEDLTAQGTVHVRFGENAVLVRKDVAEARVGERRGQRSTPTTSTSNSSSKRDGQADDGEGNPPPSAKPRSFTGVVNLNADRGALLASQVFENVVAELERTAGASVRITLEMHAEAPDGFDDDVVDVVSDNAATLSFDVKRFQ